MHLVAIVLQALLGAVLHSGVHGQSSAGNCIIDDYQVAASAKANAEDTALLLPSCSQRWRSLLQDRHLLQHGQEQRHRQLVGSNTTLQGRQKHSNAQQAGSNASFLPEWITGKKKTDAISKDWKLGDHVQLYGLKQAEFNGLNAKLVGKTSSSTWRISLDTTHQRFDVDDEHLSVQVLKPGAQVRLQGLQQAQYNDKIGRIVTFIPSTKRWEVKLKDRKTTLAVKYANLDVKGLHQEYKDEQHKKKEKEKEHQKALKKAIKKARAARDKRNHVEKIEKESSFLGLHPLQAAAYGIMFCIFVFWFNKLYKDAWYHTWGV